MRKLALAAMAASVVAMMATTVPADAAPRHGYHGGHHYGNWNGGRPHYGNRYWNYHRRHHYYNRWGWGNRWGWNPGIGIGSGIIGFGLGAAMANQYNDNRYINQYGVDDHIAACSARYRSYNPATNQFLGYDGNYHYCRL